MDTVNILVFILSALARYTRNLLDSCGHVAGEISDLRYEPEIQRMLRPDWVAPAWIGALALSAGCLAYAAYVGGAIPLLGTFVLFALGYWVFDRIPAMMPRAGSPHFIRLLHRTLKDRVNSDLDSDLKRSYSELIARIETRLGDRLA